MNQAAKIMIRKVFREALAISKNNGVDLSEGPCDCGHSYVAHAYTPRCGGSIACTICSCNNYSEAK